jgi:hypothetical protein
LVSVDMINLPLRMLVRVCAEGAQCGLEAGVQGAEAVLQAAATGADDRRVRGLGGVLAVHRFSPF